MIVLQSRGKGKHTSPKNRGLIAAIPGESTLRRMEFVLATD